MAGNESSWHVEVDDIDRIASKLEQYGEEAKTVIQEYLIDEGFKRIAPSIQNLIPASGRNWKGKKPAASKADINRIFDRYTQDGGTTLRIDSHYPDYHYLYFPNDGENTIRHMGSQHFMLRGAEAISPQVVDDILQRLTAAFNEGG